LWERNREEVLSNLRSFVRVPLSPLYENFYFKNISENVSKYNKKGQGAKDISSLKVTDGV
jgi:hypothetical protein